MTVFTTKDWKDDPDTSTPVSAAALEDLETRVTSTGGRTITAATGIPLTLLDDQEAVGTLVLGNITSGASPAKTPALVLQKNGTSRWGLGIDVTAGSVGDFALYSYTASKDILYITDTSTPGVGIGNVDRSGSGGAQLYVKNVDGANRVALGVTQATGITQTVVKLYGSGTEAYIDARNANTDHSDFRIEGSGDAISNVAGKGFVCISPNGLVVKRIGIDNAGAVAVTTYP